MFRPYFVAASFAVVFFLCELQIDESHAQRPMDMLDKPGGCPPPLPQIVCTDHCTNDHQCLGSYKCCRTACGGTLCSRPVTERANTTLIKPGLCPSYNEGPWFCTSTCTSDGDCRRSKKCCRNRCGAYSCKLPLPVPNMVPYSPKNIDY